MTARLIVTPSLSIPGRDLAWRAVRASGPGGQNVNKVATKVELRFDLAGCVTIDDEAKGRLRSIAARRINSDDILIVTSMKTRDRERNLVDAREKLAALLRRALERPRPRRPSKPTAGAKERRLDTKRRLSRRKRERQGRSDG